jgi:uroporphyrinogen-III synthase
VTRPLALLRPEPGWSASAAAARQLGLEIVGHPLFQAEPVAWEAPGGAFDALLAGSAAVFRLGGPKLSRFTHLPVHAVGEVTAEAARAAGFAVTRTGAGGLQQLLDHSADQPLRYLRPGGEERVPLDLHPGQELVERAVYRLRPLPLSSALAELIERGEPIIAVHSAAAAAHFRAEIDRLGIERGMLFLVALGPRIAKAAGLGWAAVHIADRPDDAALLAKAAALCK